MHIFDYGSSSGDRCRTIKITCRRHIRFYDIGSFMISCPRHHLIIFSIKLCLHTPVFHHIACNPDIRTIRLLTCDLNMQSLRKHRRNQKHGTQKLGTPADVKPDCKLLVFSLPGNFNRKKAFLFQICNLCTRLLQ